MKCLDLSLYIRRMSNNKMGIVLFVLILNMSTLNTSTNNKMTLSKSKAINKGSDKNQETPYIAKEANKNKFLLPELIQNNQSIFIAVLAVSIGFVIGASFIILALLYNKNTFLQISQASLQIVNSFKELTQSKVTDDVLTIHI